LIIFKESPMAITTCVFDAYGTFFDIADAARIVADEDSEGDLAHNWPKLAEIWRA
jgi:2-haloacid dehalogenase